MFAQGQDLDPTEAEGATLPGGQPDSETPGQDPSSQYVTQKQHDELLREIRRVQSSSDKGLNSIRQEMTAQYNNALKSFEMATGKAPTPEQAAAIKSRVQDSMLMGQPDQQTDQPQPGQAPAQGQAGNDAWFQAADRIAAQVEGGLTEKDPEIKLVKANAPTPQEWLDSVIAAVQAKQQRLSAQKSRQPGATNMVSGNGSPANPIPENSNQAWDRVRHK